MKTREKMRTSFVELWKVSNLYGMVHISSNDIYTCFQGFYGRPWTFEQRKDLFVKLREWGMNSYLYAPKDDYKHVR